MKKILFIIYLLLASFLVSGCSEGDADAFYVDLSVRLESADPAIRFLDVVSGRLSVYDMNYSGQGYIDYPCHGDTTIRLVKSYYMLNFDGKVVFETEDGRRHTGTFRLNKNLQETFLRDTTITMPLSKMPW